MIKKTLCAILAATMLMSGAICANASNDGTDINMLGKFTVAEQTADEYTIQADVYTVKTFSPAEVAGLKSGKTFSDGQTTYTVISKFTNEVGDVFRSTSSEIYAKNSAGNYFELCNDRETLSAYGLEPALLPSGYFMLCEVDAFLGTPFKHCISNGVQTLKVNKNLVSQEFDMDRMGFAERMDQCYKTVTFEQIAGNDRLASCDFPIAFVTVDNAGHINSYMEDWGHFTG